MSDLSFFFFAVAKRIDLANGKIHILLRLYMPPLFFYGYFFYCYLISFLESHYTIVTIPTGFIFRASLANKVRLL